MRNCRRLSYIRINPRREFKTLRTDIEEGNFDDREIDINDPNLPLYLKREIEMQQTEFKSPVIEFRVGAKEGIDMIHKEIKKLLR